MSSTHGVMGIVICQKENKTFLHELFHIMAVRFPRLGGIFRKMDDLFGYSLVCKSDSAMNDWWNYKGPIKALKIYLFKYDTCRVISV